MRFNSYEEYEHSAQGNSDKIMICHLQKNAYNLIEAQELQRFLTESLCPKHFEQVIVLNGIERIDIV